jgi:hypothetical protein
MIGRILMLARNTRRAQHTSTSAQGTAAETSAEQEISQQPIQGAEGTMTLPTALQAKLDESFRRNEDGLRYLANR